MQGSRTLLLMRHGKSSWRTNDPDVRRPLSSRGSRDAVVAGQFLARQSLDVVLVSRATRAQQTWQCAQLGGASCGDVRVESGLYEATAHEVLVLVRELPDTVRTALVIGHEPTTSDLILDLTGPSPLRGRVADKFPTAAIGVLTVPGTWADLDAGACGLASIEIPRG